MTIWYILLGIVLFFAFLLSLKANVRLEFNEELILSIHVLGIKIKILPGKEKPVNYKEYTYKKHLKRLENKRAAEIEKSKKKSQKKAAKKKKKDEKKEQKKSKSSAPKRSISDWINIAVGVLAVFFEKFSHHLHIKVARMHINVATGDAASTAIMYGAVIQSVAYVIELLRKVTNVDGLEKADISVNADYLSETTSLDLCFVFSLRVWHVFDIAFGSIGRAIKRFISTSPEGKLASHTNAHYPTPKNKKRRRKKPTTTAFAQTTDKK